MPQSPFLFDNIIHPVYTKLPWGGWLGCAFAYNCAKSVYGRVLIGLLKSEKPLKKTGAPTSFVRSIWVYVCMYVCMPIESCLFWRRGCKQALKGRGTFRRRINMRARYILPLAKPFIIVAGRVRSTCFCRIYTYLVVKIVLRDSNGITSYLTSTCI